MLRKMKPFSRYCDKYITDSKPIRFEGNNYSDEWKKEAKKRGLSNITNPVEAFDAYLSPKSKKLFTIS